MLLLFFSISFACLVVGYLTHHNFWNPQFIFVCMWTIIVFLGSLQLYGFADLNDKIFTMVLLGIISFTLGNIFYSYLYQEKIKKNKQYSSMRHISENENLYINNGIYYICVCLACIGSIITLHTALQMFISGGTYLEIRGSMLGYTDRGFTNNPYVNLFLTYVSGPILTALVPLAIFFVFRGKYKKSVLVIFLCLIANILSSGGRISILYVLIFLITAFCYFGASLSKRVRKKIPLIILLGVLLVVFLTTQRTTRRIFEAAYTYFTVPLGLLNYYSNFVENIDFYSYGGAFFYPITYIINSINKILGIDNVEISNIVEYISMPQEKWVGGIFSTGSYNAFSTLYYYFYMDFRYFGVFIFSFIFGLICEFVYLKTWIEKNNKFFPIYLLTLETVFSSFIIWQFGNTKFVLALFILWLIQTRVKHAVVDKTENG